MKPRCGAALALLLGCHSSTHESDVVAFEVTAPLHARIMMREHEEPIECSGVSGLVERVSCIFQTSLTTCTWLELDSPELAAHPFGHELQACQMLPPRSGPRIAVGDAPVHGLEVDPGGGRVAFQHASGATVVYALDGVVVGTAPVAWPVKWPAVPALDARLGEFFAGADEDTARRLLAYAEKAFGTTRVVDLMLPVADASIDRWYELYQKLDDEASKQKALGALHQRLKDEDVPLELVTGLAAYPDVQPAGYRDLVAEHAKAQVALYDDWYSVQPLLAELARRRDPLAGELSCRIYGMQVLSSQPAMNDEYYYGENIDPDAQAGALAIVGQLKTPCPWVGISLEQEPCATALRCLADGGLPDPEGEEEEMYDPDTGDAVYVARPLCSRAVAARALREATAGEASEEGLSPAPVGPLLLAIGYEQGSVSKELVARNARRMYRFVWPTPPPVNDDGYQDDAPCQRPRNLPNAICGLPLSVTEVVFNNCRARIDDKAHVVRVEVNEPK